MADRRDRNRRQVGVRIFDETPTRPRMQIPARRRVQTPTCLQMQTPTCLQMQTPTCLQVQAPTCLQVQTPTCLQVQTPNCPQVQTPNCPQVQTPNCLQVQTPNCQGCWNAMRRLAGERSPVDLPRHLGMSLHLPTVRRLHPQTGPNSRVCNGGPVRVLRDAGSNVFYPCVVEPRIERRAGVAMGFISTHPPDARP
jgi:hypothetical protein